MCRSADQGHVVGAFDLHHELQLAAADNDVEFVTGRSLGDLDLHRLRQPRSEQLGDLLNCDGLHVHHASFIDHSSSSGKARNKGSSVVIHEANR